MKLVIPMAGEGKRFVDAGYIEPKPFIPVYGEENCTTMIELVLANLGASTAFSQVILLVRKEHVVRLPSVIDRLNIKNLSIVVVDKLTEGAACTLMHAYDYLNTDEPIVVANSDQYIHTEDYNIYEFYDQADKGSILCFKCPERNPKWSYAFVNFDGRILQVAEKEPISEFATAGIYHFGSGKELLRATISMISKNIRTNNEFYICPVYNEMLNRVPITSYILKQEEMFGLGTPEDLKSFQTYFGFNK